MNLWSLFQKRREEVVLPPAPVSLVLDAPDVDFDRWDWEKDQKPFLTHRLQVQLLELMNARDEAEIRYRQGRAKELFDILNLRETEKYLAQQRYERQREEVYRGVNNARR